jgi:hypothetical protein
MSTKKDVGPTSMKDAGYQFARGTESLESITRYVMEKAPGLANEIPESIKVDLVAGFQLRKHELVGPAHYRIGEGGVYIPVTDPKGIDGLVAFTIANAVSLTPHEFGQMRQSDPYRHSIIKELRDSCGTYVSNKLGAMQKLAAQLQAGKKERTRAVNKTFIDATRDQFEALEKRVRTAQGKGDPGADPVKFKLAVNAFWKTYSE